MYEDKRRFQGLYITPIRLILNRDPHPSLVVEAQTTGLTVAAYFGGDGGMVLGLMMVMPWRGVHWGHVKVDVKVEWSFEVGFGVVFTASYDIKLGGNTCTEGEIVKHEK
jgi:hypothetical protein